MNVGERPREEKSNSEERERFKKSVEVIKNIFDLFLIAKEKLEEYQEENRGKNYKKPSKEEHEEKLWQNIADLANGRSEGAHHRNLCKLEKGKRGG